MLDLLCRSSLHLFIVINNQSLVALLLLRAIPVEHRYPGKTAL